MVIDELIALLGFETKGDGELRKFQDGLDRAEQKAQAVANRINAMQVAIGTFVGQMAVDFARGIGRTLGSLPGDVLAVGKEFENLGIRFETLEGSAEKGKEALEWVRQFAVDTPLDLAQAANAYARLKNFGIDPTNGSLLAMVDAMAASGQGLQMLERLTLATGQAWAKGKLQGEEILQLVEAGVPVWEMLEKATGKNAAELQKLSSAGKLGRDVIQLLVNEIGNKYVGASEKMAKTLDGIQDKITEAWTNFKKEVADRGFYDEFKRRTQGVLDVLEGWEKSGLLGSAAQMVSDFLTGSMSVAEQIGKALWDIGRAGFYAANGIVDLISSITGLNKVASAGILGAALLGSTRLGRGMMMALARRIPALASILLVEDILSGLRGDESYIGKLEGGQEALDKLQGSWEALGAAAEKLSKATAGLFDYDLPDDHWLLSPQDWVDRAIVAFVNDLASAFNALAAAVDAMANAKWEEALPSFNKFMSKMLIGESQLRSLVEWWRGSGEEGAETAPPQTDAPGPQSQKSGRLRPSEPTIVATEAPGWLESVAGTVGEAMSRNLDAWFGRGGGRGGETVLPEIEVSASRFGGDGAPAMLNPEPLIQALENLKANMSRLSPEAAAQAVVNDNSVANDNRDQSSHVQVNVGGVHVQQATQAPAAVGQAVGNAAARSAAPPARRITGNYQ